MSVEQDFLIVAGSSTANVDSQATFAGSGYQLNGNPPGLLRSAAINKQIRQGTTAMALIGNFIAQELNQAVIDNGTAGLPTLVSQFISAIQSAAAVALAPAVVNVAYSATPVFNTAEGCLLFPIFTITLAGNVTSSSFEGITAGQLVVLNVIQSSAGGNTFVAPTGFPMPPISSTANEMSSMTAVYLGSNVFVPVGGMTTQA